MNSEKTFEGFFTNTLSRRRFLTRSAIAAAGLPLVGDLVVPATRAAGVGANDKIHVGVRVSAAWQGWSDSPADSARRVTS